MAYINFHLRHSGYSENTLRTLQQLKLPICKVLILSLDEDYVQIPLTIDNLNELKIFEVLIPDGKCMQCMVWAKSGFFVQWVYYLVKTLAHCAPTVQCCNV